MRVALAILLLLVLAGAAMPTTAWAQPAAEAPSIEMALPLRDGDFYLGDVRARLAADGSGASFERARVLELARPVLAPEAYARLAAALGDAEFVPAATASAGQIAVLFDPAAVDLRLDVPLDAREAQVIALDRNQASQPSSEAQVPALVSGYLNLRAGLDFVASDGGGESGLQEPAVGIDGALRMGRLVLENEMLLDQGDLQRTGSRAVVDFPEQVLRVRAGDLFVVPGAFQAGADLLGVSVSRSYADLQPTRSVRPTGARSLSIDRPSNVEIYQNGQLTRRLRLPPGNYQIEDITAQLGATDIRIVVEDDAGLRQEIDFSLFSDLSLLEAGIDEFDLTVGVLSDQVDGSLEYGEDGYVASGFYRRGITENLTAGIEAQADREVRQLGAGLVQATPLGIFGVDLAGSLADAGEAGYALRLDYRSFQDTAADSINQSLQASFEIRSRDFRTIGLFGSAPEGDEMQAAFSYGRALGDRLYGSLSGRYSAQVDGGDETYGADATLSCSFGRAWSLTTTLGYGHGDDDPGFRLFASLIYNFDYRTQLRADHDTRSGRSRLAFTRSGTGNVGSYDLDLEAEQVDDEAGLVGSISYYANRGEVGASHRIAMLPEGDGFDQRTSLRAATAVAFAGSTFAVGRPIANSFALVELHPTLDGRTVAIGPSQEQVDATGDAMMPALVPSLSSYAPQRLVYDVDDLPLGYDLGAGVFDLFPPYRAGYAVTVGSDYTITALGTLQDREQVPVALVSGQAIELAEPDRPPVPFFTNATGRFVVQGLRPGRWRLQVDGSAGVAAEIVIPEGGMGLVELGELQAGLP
ncbi:fimbria/pilus outer membrane usher protein [Geminicoccus roseus]|uniref:fimbria/pilus outer membrane usher protein n=1 Tax=Geminicoccus roseus TaxID=404900 RepID=UPI0004014B3B|nr:fimbria/pilus outer membrane usher protein [Geminicoccus roseus]